MDTNPPLGSGPLSSAPAGVNPKILHNRPLGQPVPVQPGGQHSLAHLEETLKPVSRLNPDQRPLPIEQAGLPAVGSKITAFGKDKHHEQSWTRTPNTTGQGAIHVKTFHCKLTDEALLYMDQLINEWLDAHPQYEVKFCLSTIGTFTGKLKEPALICQVWV